MYARHQMWSSTTYNYQRGENGTYILFDACITIIESETVAKVQIVDSFLLLLIYCWLLEMIEDLALLCSVVGVFSFFLVQLKQLRSFTRRLVGRTKLFRAFRQMKWWFFILDINHISGIGLLKFFAFFPIFKYFPMTKSPQISCLIKRQLIIHHFSYFKKTDYFL